MATTSEPAVANSSQPSSASLLSIRSVAKHFGKNIVLRDISLEIAEGEFLTILGESGSGKTTLLRILAGFEQSTSGEVWMAGERLDTAASLSPPRQHRLPELRALPAHDRRTKRRLRISDRQTSRRRNSVARQPKRWPRSRCPPTPNRSRQRSAADSSNASRSPARW